MYSCTVSWSLTETLKIPTIKLNIESNDCCAFVSRCTSLEGANNLGERWLGSISRVQEVGWFQFINTFMLSTEVLHDVICLGRQARKKARVGEEIHTAKQKRRNGT